MSPKLNSGNLCYGLELEFREYKSYWIILGLHFMLVCPPHINYPLG